MTAQEAGLVLRDEWARTGGQEANFLLNLLYIILARLKIDLR